MLLRGTGLDLEDLYLSTEIRVKVKVPLPSLVATLKQQETTACSGCCNIRKVFSEKEYDVSVTSIQEKRSEFANFICLPHRNGEKIQL